MPHSISMRFKEIAIAIDSKDRPFVSLPASMVGGSGLEPLTSSLSATRSNQLSYSPKDNGHSNKIPPLSQTKFPISQKLCHFFYFPMSSSIIDGSSESAISGIASAKTSAGCSVPTVTGPTKNSLSLDFVSAP